MYILTSTIYVFYTCIISLFIELNKINAGACPAKWFGGCQQLRGRAPEGEVKPPPLKLLNFQHFQSIKHPFVYGDLPKCKE